MSMQLSSAVALRRPKRRTFEDYPPGARKLICIAERLFGESGIEGVSLPQIILRSNQANNSAIQHHFGTKAGLVQAVYEMRLAKLDAASRRMLEAMSRKESQDPQCVLIALLTPPCAPSWLPAKGKRSVRVLDLSAGAGTFRPARHRARSGVFFFLPHVVGISQALE